MNREIIDYAAQVGAGPLLVQGAGGNISWKDGNTLWVKASGAWLAEAKEKDIFLPLDLAKARRLAKDGVDDFSSAMTTKTSLRPSIETAQHALLPQPVVVHVHAVDALAHAVRQNARHALAPKLAGLRWMWAAYAKPGAELAMAVSRGIVGKCAPDFFILGNHGLIVNGPDIGKVDRLLRDVLTRLHLDRRKVKAADKTQLAALEKEWAELGYRLPKDISLHALALDPVCLALAKDRWALYPDHVVFLGANAPLMNAGETPESFLARFTPPPPFVIVPDKGILVSKKSSPAQKAMIVCFADVTRRLDGAEGIVTLTGPQVADLLGWEKEKMRKREP